MSSNVADIVEKVLLGMFSTNTYGVNKLNQTIVKLEFQAVARSIEYTPRVKPSTAIISELGVETSPSKQADL